MAKTLVLCAKHFYIYDTWASYNTFLFLYIIFDYFKNRSIDGDNRCVHNTNQTNLILAKILWMEKKNGILYAPLVYYIFMRIIYTNCFWWRWQCMGLFNIIIIIVRKSPAFVRVLVWMRYSNEFRVIKFNE